MLPDASDAVLHVAGDLHHPALLMSLSEWSLVDLPEKLARSNAAELPPFLLTQQRAGSDR